MERFTVEDRREVDIEQGDEWDLLIFKVWTTDTPRESIGYVELSHIENARGSRSS